MGKKKVHQVTSWNLLTLAAEKELGKKKEKISRKGVFVQSFERGVS